jgi:tetratricopeptide (TPR) repeat protein/DNA-binding transcriptional ArsR family regulator/energy-coupling factor transporter ATP-binding protein EcfA2
VAALARRPTTLSASRELVMTALVAHKYMPEQMPDAELRATFTAREHTLDFLVNALRDQIRSRTLTSYLITGPRGSGKTTLVLMFCLRIREDPELATAWLPVRFPEELPAITSLRDLFAAALAVMSEDGIDGARAWHERVEREPDERRSRDLAVTALRRIVEERGKRLILFIENFDQLFERTSTNEEAVLRRLLMADPFMLIVGTTVRQFEALRSYGRALFNYFCEVPLKRLDDDQVRALLISRADWDGRPDVVKRARAHQADIQAICRLTGGNPRLAVMLYEILGQGDMTSIVTTLRQLVDELTPLLKDVLDNQLTNQQRKIVDALMRSGGTATPRALAGATRLTLNTVTTQLQRLKEAELVEARGGGKGRPAHYFVPDQLFSTWYQMRYLRPGRRRVELFVEVLRTWFQAEERLRTVKSMVAAASGSAGGPLVAAAVVAEYYAASLAGTEHARVAFDLAVAARLKTGNLQEAAFALAELRDVRSGDRLSYEANAHAELARWAESQGDVATEIEALRAAMGKTPTNLEMRLRYAIALDKNGEHLLAVKRFDEILSAATDPRVKSSALVFRGMARKQQGDVSGSIDDFSDAIDLKGALRESVVVARICRARLREQLGDTSGAIADYTAVVELQCAPTEEVAKARLRRGGAREKDDRTGPIEDHTAVIELKSAARTEMAWALLRRGTATAEQAGAQDAIEDFTRVATLDGALPEQIAMALLLRGIARDAQGDQGGAIHDYTTLIEMTGAPARTVAGALINRGSIREQQGDPSGAIADYTAVMERGKAPADLTARALLRRGTMRAGRDDVLGALDDFTTVIGTEGVQPEELASAFYNRGVVQGRRGDAPKAVADCTAVVELPGAPLEDVAAALLNRGVMRGQLDDMPAAIDDCTRVTELSGVPRVLVAAALVNRGFLRRKKGDALGAIDDLAVIGQLSEITPSVRAVALFNRAQAYLQAGQLNSAFDDAIAAAEIVGAEVLQRALALVIAGRVSSNDGQVQRVCAVAREAVSSIGSDQQAEFVAGLLGGLSSPKTLPVWMSVWRSIARYCSEDARSSLPFLDAVADVLEGHDRSVLNPLPPEQREFAGELLRKFELTGDESLTRSSALGGERQ